VLGTDELGQIETINNFGGALTNGRKPGLFTISGAQHVEQVKRRYGGEAKEIFSSFGTKLILGQGDTESAEFWSREIGTTEIREWHKSEGQSSGDGRNNRNSGQSEHIRMRPRVLAHELRELPKLTGYLLIGHFPAARVSLQPPKDLPMGLVEGFTPRLPTDEPTAGEALRKQLNDPRPAASLSLAAGQAELDLSELDSSEGARK
jgi:hypothetical protein